MVEQSASPGLRFPQVYEVVQGLSPSPLFSLSLHWDPAPRPRLPAGPQLTSLLAKETQLRLILQMRRRGRRRGPTAGT